MNKMALKRVALVFAKMAAWFKRVKYSSILHGTDLSDRQTCRNGVGLLHEEIELKLTNLQNSLSLAMQRQSS